MSNRWQRSRMAADYESTSSDVATFDERSALEVAIAGGGASYGGGDDEWLGLLPDGYYRQFASAMPSIREGAYDPYRIDSEPPVRDPGNRVTDATLQRERKVRGRGRSQGGGRSKKKPYKGGRPADGDEPRSGMRCFAWGLTRGERLYYEPRLEESTMVTNQLAELIRVEQRPPEIVKIKQFGQPLPNFAIPNISEPDVIRLRSCRGALRWALVAHAHARDHDRIVYRDTLEDTRRREREIRERDKVVSIRKPVPLIDAEMVRAAAIALGLRIAV